MKKFTMLLILIVLSFNVLIAAPAFAVTNLKEGIYQLSNFNISPGNLYSIKNISTTDNAYVLLFDEDQRTLQAIRLGPNSENYKLLPLKPNYRILIIGNGEIVIS
ncbi:hypothetical protein [Clostridium sp.]|jgi:hypothetical protein|uniref:hypothetical protein n=1 Tax=Clostridium sp. TaxID=1506 RepID=UPI002847A6AF|nr:hypothetical protein [Clostridium sp.]MDR3598316.1 hypothetical protein [Clostridium sp.]